MRSCHSWPVIALLACCFSCVTKKDPDMEKQIRAELLTIDSLLKSPGFSLKIAQSQHAAYYSSLGQPVPPFLTDAEETGIIKKSGKEEKIAINLAGFYALECGLGLLCAQDHASPADWLLKISSGTIDASTSLLLNRFANATWKAGQPFRSLERIRRPVFTCANFLPAEEVKKDALQIKAAALKLLSGLEKIKDSSVEIQLQQIRSLLHSRAFALEMAKAISTGDSDGGSQTTGSFFSPADDTAFIQQSVKEQKIATNLAGFYALECCTSYLVSTGKTLPSSVLTSILNNSISLENKDLFARFANATWKAGQPFSGLERIGRETFAPFYFLSEADREKDWVQIKAAAKMVLAEL